MDRHSMSLTPHPHRAQHLHQFKDSRVAADGHAIAGDAAFFIRVTHKNEENSMKGKLP
jgi:hypothetical protein